MYFLTGLQFDSAESNSHHLLILIMNNETDYLLAQKYNILSQQLTKYLGSLLYLLCLFGTLMNILTFSQRIYTCRACSLYLLFASVCDLTHLNAGALSNILDYGFLYRWNLPSSLYCSIKNYIVYYFTIVSGTLTVLASFDRFFLSSSNNYFWSFSSRRIAKYCIRTILIFWFFLSLPISLCSQRRIHSSGNEEMICSNSLDNPLCYFTRFVYSCLIDGFLPPSIMMILGILTSRNARLLYRRAPSERTSTINQQLTSMLIIQSIKSIFASYPIAIFNCYLLITRLHQKTILMQAKENLLLQIAYLLFWSNYTSFFVYLFSSDVFRHQLMRALKMIFLCRCCRQNKRTKNIRRPKSKRMHIERMTNVARQ